MLKMGGSGSFLLAKRLEDWSQSRGKPSRTIMPSRKALPATIEALFVRNSGGLEQHDRAKRQSNPGQ